MRTKKKFLLLAIILIAGSQASLAQSVDKSLTQISTLFEGTWQINGKAAYEKWEKSAGASLMGKGYKVKDEKESISERLEIRILDGKIVYLATVPNQNNGATVKFTLTSSKDNEFVFENPEHDFPKKIIYKKVSDTEMFVRVLGDGEKGFSQTFKRLQP